MATKDRSRVPLKGWQWAEIGLFVVLLYGQLGLMFTVLKDRSGFIFLVSLLPMALAIHMYTWLIPLWKARRG